ncbi:MAG: TonB family protein [Symploca sp. SIO1C2]|nr:TonB family protein [Symploca sp. SIO1C2]
MSYSSFLKHFPDKLAQPTGIAVMASVVVHSLVAITLPYWPVFSSEQANELREVELVELTPEMASRLPPPPKPPEPVLLAPSQPPSTSSQKPAQNKDLEKLLTTPRQPVVRRNRTQSPNKQLNRKRNAVLIRPGFTGKNVKIPELESQGVQPRKFRREDLAALTTRPNIATRPNITTTPSIIPGGLRSSTFFPPEQPNNNTFLTPQQPNNNTFLTSKPFDNSTFFTPEQPNNNTFLTPQQLNEGSFLPPEQTNDNPPPSPEQTNDNPPPSTEQPNNETALVPQRPGSPEEKIKRMRASITPNEENTSPEEAEENIKKLQEEWNQDESAATQASVLGSYPTLACYKKLEGTSVVGVLVGSDGKATQQQLIQSAGYPLFDEQAQQDIQSRSFENKTGESKFYRVNVNFEYNKDICPFSRGSKKSTPEDTTSPEESTTQQSTSEGADSEKKTTQQSTSEDSDSEEKATQQPTSEDSDSEEKATQQPTLEDSDSEEKATQQPTLEDSDSEEKATQQPTSEDSDSEEKATQQPASEDSDSEKSIDD